MTKAMIITVGGTAEPILKSIKHYAPSFVVYLVSEQTEKQVEEILNKSKIDCIYEIVRIKDPQNLIETYAKSLDAAKLVRSRGFEKNNVIVEYTGGTKPMSAGVVLATVSENFVFSYVGGIERNKGNLGVVITGKEEIFKRLSPWLIFATKEKEIAVEFFNKYRYSSSLEMLKTAEEKLAPFPDKKEEIDNFILMVKAYDAWDKFDHKEARDILQKIERRDVSDNLDFLNELLKRKALFKKDLEKNSIKMEEVPTEHLIIDLFSNAGRRAEEGKYDDACARLYRTLESLGQFILLKDYNIDSSDVKLENLRGKIQEDYIKEYENKRDRKSGKIKLGLVENFDLLKKLNNSFISIYNEKEEELKAYLNFRNNSILAHGFNPIEEEHYWKLEKSIRELLSKVINNFDDLFHKTKFPTASI